MFREMRRKKQLLKEEDSIGILKTCTAGVLGVNGDDGYPYTVPMSYAYVDGKMFMHSAKEGHKIDSIKKNNKVTFTVIEKDEVIQHTFTTHYRSVSVFGKARLLIDDKEKRIAIEKIVEKYSPDYLKEAYVEIEKEWDRLCLIEIKIEHMTGKAAIEIINND